MYESLFILATNSSIILEKTNKTIILDSSENKIFLFSHMIKRKPSSDLELGMFPKPRQKAVVSSVDCNLYWLVISVKTLCLPTQ